MRLYTIIVFLISSLTSYGQNVYPDHYKTDSFEGVLFGKADNIFVKTNSANPSRTEVDAAERLLSHRVDSIQNQFNKNSQVAVEITKKYASYKRQYFAYVNGTGQKIIILAFNYSPGVFLANKWSMTPQVVDDGWDQYWRISFNTETCQFFDFHVNSLGG